VRGCTDYTQEARGWAKSPVKKPVTKRLTVFLLAVIALVMLASSLWPHLVKERLIVESTKGQGAPQGAPQGATLGASQGMTPGTMPEATQGASQSTKAPDSNNSNGSLLPDSKAEGSATVVVYLTGAVLNPGVYELKEASRLHDVVVLAGGLVDGAAANYINLAAPLKDGTHIHIPFVSEIDSGEAARITANGAKDGTEYSNPATTEKLSQSRLVNINTATAAELETLPGVGPVTSKRIIDYREKYGGFKSIEELKNVSGIGDKTFEGLADKVCV